MYLVQVKKNVLKEGEEMKRIILTDLLYTVCVNVLLVGCYSNAAEPKFYKGDNVEIPPQIADNWIGYEFEAAPGKWEEIGAVPRGNKSILDANAMEEINAVQALNEAKGNEEIQFDILNFSNDRMYSVTIGRADVDLVSEMIGNETVEGQPEDEAEMIDEVIDNEEETMIEKSFSNGIDNRKNLGVGHNNTTRDTNPYNTIGQLNGFCTGTMIQCRNNNTICYVLTATHCMYDKNNNYVDTRANPVFFSPRRDDNKGCGNKCAGEHPYGQWPVVDGYIMSKFRRDQCYKDSVYSSSDSCKVYDMMILKVEKCATCTFPGTMGRTLTEASSISSYNKYHRGYRSNHNLYGDGALTLGKGYSKADGWYRLYHHSSDSLPGHSGGPLYVVKNNKYYLFGINVAGSDCGDDCGSHPNVVRWLDKFMADMINYWVTL